MDEIILSKKQNTKEGRRINDIVQLLSDASFRRLFPLVFFLCFSIKMNGDYLLKGGSDCM
jgi:hypothetical protein